MIKGSVAFKPYVIEYLPADATTGGVNQGYGMLIMNKIEEMENNGELITAPLIREKLKIGKTTVLKHLKRLMKQGFLTTRLAKIQHENSTVITPVYMIKKTKRRKNGKH